VTADLERELEAIGRRLSPRLDRAHDAVTRHAEAGAPPWTPWPWVRAAGPRPGRRALAGVVAAVAAGITIASLTAPAPGSRSATAGAARAGGGPGIAEASGPGLAAPTAAAATQAPITPGQPPPPSTGAGGPAVPGGPPQPPGPAAVLAGPGPVASGPSPPPRTAGPGEPASAAGMETPPPSSWAAAAGSSGTRAPLRESPTGTSGGAACTGPAPAAASVVTLTEADRGRTICVRRGQRIQVDLSAEGRPWTAPAAVQSSPVLSTDTSSAGADGSAEATFSAAAAGRSVIHAEQAPGCTGSSPCPAPQPFDVTVLVSG
jgi:hypothetical protein